MPLVVFTLVFTPAETSMLPGKLPTLDLKVADAMQYDLEDVSHRGVVDRTRIAFDYPLQNLLLTLRVVDGGTCLGLERHDLLHEARPLAQRPDELLVYLVHPLPELLDFLLHLSIRHRICDCTSVGFRYQVTGIRKTVRCRDWSLGPPLLQGPVKGLSL